MTRSPSLNFGKTEWWVSNFKKWLPFLLFGILWADLVHQLSYQWQASEQYAYGWFVPILGLGLFWRKWIARPNPEPHWVPYWVRLLMGGLLASLLPVRVVYEINADWPLCSWWFGITVVTLTLYAVLLAGGWKWVRHFAFPVCFILIAVRWPYRIENGLSQGLMHVVANGTVGLLGWLNVPAVQHGNLIEVSTGTVGVEEACSGIRSFQSTLMGALFLGELYRLRWTPRLWLLAVGLLLAFGLNVVRTLLLTWQANFNGLAAVEKWHDPAGFSISLICFAGLWGLCGLMNREKTASRVGQPSRPNEKHTSAAEVTDFVQDSQ